MQTLFISDLHLCDSRPEMIDAFEKLLSVLGPETDALYILGDLFEFWHGDDDLSEEHLRITRALTTLTNAGIPVYFQRGNRDFLVGIRFSEITGATLLPDFHVIDLYGTRTLVMHGDLLCTDDTAYQFMRRIFSLGWLQWLYLHTGLGFRRRISARARDYSRQENRRKSPEIMDVNENSVTRAMLAHGVQDLIHGHTHRPGIHQFEIPTGAARRMVLGDWYEKGSLLLCRTDCQMLIALDDFFRSEA